MIRKRHFFGGNYNRKLKTITAKAVMVFALFAASAVYADVNY